MKRPKTGPKSKPEKNKVVRAARVPKPKKSTMLWQLKSESSPEWNGSGNLLMVNGVPTVPPAVKAHLDAMGEKHGERPTDLKLKILAMPVLSPEAKKAARQQKRRDAAAKNREQAEKMAMSFPNFPLKGNAFDN